MKSLLKIGTKLSVIFSLLLLVSCEDNRGEDRVASLSFDLRLPEDGNGYYHLKIDRFNWQTLHRVSANVTSNDYPVEGFWITWYSSMYWYLGDTLGYIVNRDFSVYQGRYVTRDTSFMIGFSGMEVPTTNATSISNGDGEINNMIAPVRSMIGDTLYLTAEWFDGFTTFGIVLD